MKCGSNNGDALQAYGRLRKDCAGAMEIGK